MSNFAHIKLQTEQQLALLTWLLINNLTDKLTLTVQLLPVWFLHTTSICGCHRKNAVKHLRIRILEDSSWHNR